MRTSDARGFTLLELLVVVALVGILTGTVVLGLGRADAEYRLAGHADQLAYRVELARQFALQRNREWGLYVESERIRFVEYDPEAGRWVTQTREPFKTLTTFDGVKFRAETETLARLPTGRRNALPDVLLFSSGETTPFTVYLEPRAAGRAWSVQSDGLSRVRAERPSS
ncbi:MAG: type II secretion system minor pseudopilin GspH [Gammaproteobacteria bacterium]